MFKLMMTMKKKTGMTRQEFIDYYENRHAVLLQKLSPSADMYRRNYIISNDPFVVQSHEARAAGENLGEDFDCITEVAYSTREAAVEAMKALFSERAHALVLADEANFIAPESVKLYVVETRESKVPW